MTLKGQIDGEEAAMHVADVALCVRGAKHERDHDGVHKFHDVERPNVGALHLHAERAHRASAARRLQQRLDSSMSKRTSTRAAGIASVLVRSWSVVVLRPRAAAVRTTPEQRSFPRRSASPVLQLRTRSIQIVCLTTLGIDRFKILAAIPVHGLG